MTLFCKNPVIYKITENRICIIIEKKIELEEIDCIQKYGTSS